MNPLLRKYVWNITLFSKWLPLTLPIQMKLHKKKLNINEDDEYLVDKFWSTPKFVGEAIFTDSGKIKIVLEIID